MRFLPCPCPLARDDDDDSGGQSHHSSSRAKQLVSSDSSNSYSLSSQLSLPSVPTLTAPPSAAFHHQCAATVKAHSSYVFALALAGKHLFSGSHDGEIRVWPRSEIQSCHLTEGDSNGVAAVNGKAAVKSIVALGDKLFSAHQDHKIRVWKVEEAAEAVDQGRRHRLLRCVATLPTLEDRFSTLFSAKNYVRVRRNKAPTTWVHHVDTVSALALSHDGAHLYSASWDRTVKIWRTSDFRCVESIPDAHDDAINALAVSYDGRVYTGSADRRIKVWIKQTGGNNKVHHSLAETLEKHRSAVNALALAKDGVLYSGACDRSVVVWERDARGGETVVVGALRGHSKAILCLAVVGDELLCSGSADKTVRVWRRGPDRAYACLAVLGGHAKPVKCLSAAVDGETYVVHSGGLDCEIRAWQISPPSL